VFLSNHAEYDKDPAEVLEEALAFLATWDKVPKSQLLEVRHGKGTLNVVHTTGMSDIYSTSNLLVSLHQAACGTCTGLGPCFVIKGLKSGMHMGKFGMQPRRLSCSTGV
jgi:hypothetical protein